MLNARKFLAAMTLPPTHSGFPHPSLLHGILATSARMVSADFFGFEAKYWGDAAGPAEYHAKCAQVSLLERFASRLALLTRLNRAASR